MMRDVVLMVVVVVVVFFCWLNKISKQERVGFFHMKYKRENDINDVDASSAFQRF